MKEGAMEIVFWVIVTIIALAVVDLCALGFRKRKEEPDTKEHGVDLQARRKTYDDVTWAIWAARDRFLAGFFYGALSASAWRRTFPVWQKDLKSVYRGSGGWS